MNFQYFLMLIFKISNRDEIFISGVTDIKCQKQILWHNEEYWEYCPYYWCAYTKYIEAYVYKICSS